MGQQAVGRSGIFFATDTGRVVVLRGPSGGGTSTTLRMSAGLDPPSVGRIVIDGRDVMHVAPAARRITTEFAWSE